MKPDLTNEHGIAALFIGMKSEYQHGMNYILTTDGEGLMVENKAGGADWVSFTALPDGVDIADVAYWTPWTIYTQGNAWWMRSTAWGTWIEAATGSETVDEAQTKPPKKPDIPNIIEE